MHILHLSIRCLYVKQASLQKTQWQDEPMEFRPKPRPICIAVLRDRCVYMTCVVGRAVCLGYIKVNIIIIIIIIYDIERDNG